MIEIGKYNTLAVLKKTPTGLYLGDGNEEIVLSSRDAVGQLKIGEQLNVFVYLNAFASVIHPHYCPSRLESYVESTISQH